MSCGCGKKKCNGKCGISPSVLQINNNECTLFHKVEIPAVMGDETTNPPKTGAYRNVLLYYEASGNSYLYSSDGIPTKLTGVVSDYEVLTNKPSINGVVLIKNKTLADLGIISAIDSAVADEATARENADNALSDRITTNTNNIAANATAISNEATARTNADNTLSARISGNTTAINNEKTARENADTALSNRITANANAISAETTARENADNALSGRITANADSISGEKTARENADAGLQDQITAVKATADSAVQPDDINKTVMSDLAVDSNSSTAQVILKESKVNLKTGATSSEQTSLPVASSSQAGVMNSATYDAVTSNTSNINAIMNGAVAITGLSANPSQSDLTTAWQNETGLSTLINRASVYDVTNNKVWTYYTNDTTWHAASNTSSVTVNTFTNSSEGTIKGSTNIGQVFAENDGTGSVNGWDALSSDVANAKSKLSGIQSGAEVNVQSDWNVSDSSSDAYIKNKPTIGNGTLTIQKNGTTIDTFTANSTTNKTVNITVPTVNDATLTIQKNGDTVQTFTANSSSNKTANIEVPTKTSELDNDAGFIANDTHQVCGEGGNITLDTTTFEPLEMNHLKGNTSQQTYTGKNLTPYPYSGYTLANGVTFSSGADGSVVLSGQNNGSANSAYFLFRNDNSPIELPAGTYSFIPPSNTAVGYVLVVGSSYLDFNAGNNYTRTFNSAQSVRQIYIQVPKGDTATFSNLKIYPMLSTLSGQTAADYEPYVGGVPAPNPDYPQAVQTVTGENVVKICGKNLFATPASATINGITFTLNSDGTYNISGTSTARAQIIRYIDASLLENGATYTAKANKPLSDVIARVESNSDFNTYLRTNYILNSSTQQQTAVLDGSGAALFVMVIRVESGKTVNISGLGIQLEKGQATDFEPYQGQSYEVNLGKNLFDAANADVKTGYILNDSGVEVSDNTGGYTRNYSVVKPNTTYTISGLVNAGTRRIYYYDGAKNFISRSGGSGASSWQFTTPANCHYVNVQIYTNTDNSTSMASWQIEIGSQATDFAAYFEPIELCKIGDYRDSIYKSGDKWYVHKATSKANLATDRTSLGKINAGGSFRGFTVSVNTGANVRTPDGAEVIPLFCNMLACTNRSRTYEAGSQNSISAGTTSEYYKDFFFDPAPINDYSVADAETWLNNNPIIVYYPLATPTDTEITNETLLAQLEALWEADGYDSQTNIALTYAEGNAQGILSVCQYPSHLPIATKSKLGTIIVGHGLDIKDDGRLDVIVDSALSDSSINPVQNKAITTELNSKADISSVPTKTSQLENDSGFVVNDTTEICDEGSDITLNGTLLEPLDVKKIEGATSQQTYSGKNLFNLNTSARGSSGGNNAVSFVVSNSDLTITQTGNGGNGNVWFEIPNSDSLLGKTVSISVGSMAHSGTTSTGRIIIYTNNLSEVANFSSITSSGWSASFSFPNSYPSGASSFRVYAYLNNANTVTSVGSTTKFTNIQLELGSSPSSFEPYVGGTPAPNPDYPQAVQTVTGENVVKICGKNLFDVSAIPYVAKRAYGSDGSELVWSNFSGIDGYQQVAPNTTYTITKDASGNVSYLCEYDKNKAFIQRKTDQRTFTTTANTHYLRWSVFSQGDVAPTQTQLELGSTATTYEPYQGQSYEVNLGDIELCKIGDYQDYIYKSGDKWYVHKVINKYTTTGSENWTQYQAGFYYATNVFATPVMKRVACYCDTLKGFAASDTISTFISDSSDTSYAANTHTTQGLLRIKNIDMASLADFKTWLAANPTTVYYPLATPTDTEITNEALITQLEALWEADGVEGETNIFTASDGVNERAILSVCQYPSHLPIATKTKLGTVVVGHGLDIEADGKLDVIVDDDFSTESDHPVQNKVITNALAGKADNTDLSTVAMTGSYDDLTGKPTIPTVNNATLTIQKNGTNVATFTANSSTNVTANITAPVVTMTTTDPGEGGALAANNFIGVYV